MTQYRQPTRTSCGQTCVAMIVGVDPREVITRSKGIRPSRLDRTKVSDLIKLLASYGFDVGPRQRDPVAEGLLRWHKRLPSGRFRGGWHWVAVHDGRVYDPAADGAMGVVDFVARHADDKLIFYPVDRLTLSVCYNGSHGIHPLRSGHQRGVLSGRVPHAPESPPAL